MMKRILWLALVWVIALPLWSEVKNTCVECHQQAEEEELRVPVEQWKTSIHYKGGISCSDCHGGDPKQEDEDLAMSEETGFVGVPEDTEIPDFCGKCHSAVRDNYMQSAHAEALLADEDGPTCVTCHTAHEQQRASLDLINEDLCGTCHDYDQALRLKEAMRAMEGDLISMEARVEALFSEGLDVESEQRALFAVRNRTHRLTHVLDIDRILLELGSVRADLMKLDSRVTEQENIVRNRKRVGTILIVFFLLAAVLARMYYHSLKEEYLKTHGGGGSEEPPTQSS